MIKHYKFLFHNLMTEEMKIEIELLKNYDIYVDATKKDYMIKPRKLTWIIDLD